MFQSTHPRRVRLRESHIFCDYCRVSIHAPTKGATSCGCSQASASYCFNPRTHEGCDWRASAHSWRRSCFNPRTHEGCDATATDGGGRGQVSIHAPTKGATLLQQWRRRRIRCFNPRTHEGCDPVSDRRLHLLVVSIHAPTKGATTYSGGGLPANVFQSTHPRRVRLAICIFSNRTRSVSIHAPTKGATTFDPNGADKTVFQSTHPRRVRLEQLKKKSHG